MIQKSIEKGRLGISKYLKNNKVILIFLLCLLLSRIHHILFQLHGVNFDEAAIDYNIFCISNYGVDRYNNPFPVYFANYTSGQSALYIYLGAFLTKIIGFSVGKCRLIKLAGEIITFIYGGKVIRKFFSKRTEMIFYFLYIICPYFFMMGDISFDCDLIIPVFVLCMYFSEKCLETEKTSCYIGLGVCIGLLGYSYIIGVLIAPLFLLYQFIVNRKKNLYKTAIVAAVMDLPLALYVLTLFNIIPEIKSSYITIAGVSSSRISDLGFSTNNLYNLKYMLVTDPGYDFSGSMNFGTVYQLSWVFILAGVVVFFINKKKNLRFIGLLACAFCPLLFIRNATTYNYTILYFFLLAFTAIGIEILFYHYKTIGLITLAGYIIMFAFFCREYFVAKPYIYSDDAVIEAVQGVSTEEKVMLDTTGVVQPECYIGIALKVHPKDICYNERGYGLSVGNIIFNDYMNYMEYDTALIRTEFFYLYQQTEYSGLSDSYARKIASEYMENGYERKQIYGYYVFQNIHN